MRRTAVWVTTDAAGKPICLLRLVSDNESLAIAECGGKQDGVITVYGHAKRGVARLRLRCPECSKILKGMVRRAEKEDSPPDLFDVPPDLLAGRPEEDGHGHQDQ